MLKVVAINGLLQSTSTIANYTAKWFKSVKYVEFVIMLGSEVSEVSDPANNIMETYNRRKIEEISILSSCCMVQCRFFHFES